MTLMKTEKIHVDIQTVCIQLGMNPDVIREILSDKVKSPPAVTENDITKEGSPLAVGE